MLINCACMQYLIFVLYYVQPACMFPNPLQSSLAQLGIPFTDVVKVLVAILLLGNSLFYEAKNQELSVQGVEGM